jgi:hypothetical protein
MNYVIVCGSPNAGGREDALAVVLGLGVVAALWVHHRRAARRAAARQILPLKKAAEA